MGPTGVHLPVLAEKATGNLQDRLVIEVLSVAPQVAQKRDPSGMAEEEGGFMVTGIGLPVPLSFQGGDPQGHSQPVAVRAHGAARWGRGGGGSH